MNTQGNALENQEKYMESFAGKLQEIKNTLQEFWIEFLDSDKADSVLDLLNNLTKALLGLQKVAGSFGTLGVTLTGILGFKAFSNGMEGKASALSSIFDTIKSKITSLRKESKLQAEESVASSEAVVQANEEQAKSEQDVANASMTANNAEKQGVVTETAENIASKKNSDANKQQAQAQREVGEASAEAASKTLGAAKADIDEGVTSKTNSAANKEQEASQRGLSVALSSMGKATAVGLIISVAISLLSKLIDKVKELEVESEESFGKSKVALVEYNNELSSILSNNKKLPDLIKKYEALSKGVDKYGSNISLSTKQFEEYNSVANEIADLFPTLISGYTDTGTAIIKLTDAYKILNEMQAKALEDQYYKFIEDDTTLKSWKYAYSEGYFSKQQIATNRDGLSDTTRIQLIEGIIDRLNSENEDYYNKLSLLYDDIFESGLQGKYGIELPKAPTFMTSQEDTKAIIEEYKKTQLPTLYKAIETIESEIDEKLSGVRTLAEAYLKVNSDYKALEDENKAVLDEIIKNISFDTAKNWTNKSQVNSYVIDIVKEFKDASPELQDALADAVAFDASSLDPDTAYEALKVYIDNIYALLEDEYANDPEKAEQLKELWSNILGLPDIQDQYLSRVRHNMDIAGVTDTSDLGTGEYAKVEEYYRALSAEQKKVWLEVTEGIHGADNAIKAYEESVNEVRRNQTWDSFLADNKDFGDSLKEYYKQIASLKDLYEKLRSGSLSSDDVLTLQIEFGIDTTDSSTIEADLRAKINQIRENLQSEQFDSILGDRFASPEVLNHVSQLATEIRRVSDEALGLKNTFRNNLDVVSDVQNLEAAFSALDGVMADIVDKEEFDYSSIINNADFTNMFGDLDSYEEFISTIINNTENIEATREAFNQLATEYLYGSNALDGLTEAEARAIQKMLEQNGVINAQEVVTSALADLQNYEAAVIQDLTNANEALSYSKQDLALQSDALDTYTWQEIASFVEEANSADYTAQRLAAFALQKAVVQGYDLSNDTDIEYLLSLAQAAGIATEAMVAFASIKADIASTEAKLASLPVGSADWINAQYDLKNLNERLATTQKQVQSSVNNFKPVEITPVKLQYSGGKETKNAINSARKEAEKAQKQETQAEKDLSKERENALDKGIDYLKKKLDSQQISFKDYLNQRNDLIKVYYNQGLIDADKYYEELSKYYEDALSDYDKVVSAVTKTLDNQADALKDVEEEAKKSYQAQIDVIQSQIDLLEKANKAREKSIDLQKKEYELARAQNQRTRLIYKNGQLVYENDAKKVRDAQNDLTNAKYDLYVESLKEQITVLEDELDTLTDSIDGQIDKLNEYKEKWSEISDLYEDTQNFSLAGQVLGSDWQSKVLNADLDTLNKFVASYETLEQGMRNMSTNSAYSSWMSALSEAGLYNFTGVSSPAANSYIEEKFAPLANISSDKIKQYSAMSSLLNSVPSLANSISKMTTALNAAKVNQGISNPVINIANTSFTCTGVTGAEVLKQIENNFSGLLINAYQQIMK